MGSVCSSIVVNYVPDHGFSTANKCFPSAVEEIVDWDRVANNVILDFFPNDEINALTKGQRAAFHQAIVTHLKTDNPEYTDQKFPYKGKLVEPSGDYATFLYTEPLCAGEEDKNIHWLRKIAYAANVLFNVPAGNLPRFKVCEADLQAELDKIRNQKPVGPVIAPPATPPQPAKIPGAVTNLKVDKSTSGSCTISWTRADNAKIYSVVADGGKAQKTAETGDPSLVINKLQPETKYTITVEPKNDTQAGPKATVECVTKKKSVTPPRLPSCPDTPSGATLRNKGLCQ
jgi:hypothetical protein